MVTVPPPLLRVSVQWHRNLWAGEQQLMLALRVPNVPIPGKLGPGRHPAVSLVLPQSPTEA